MQSGPLLDADEIPYTPDLTSKVGIEYTIPLSLIQAELMIRGDGSFTDSAYSEFRETNPGFRTELKKTL